MNKDILIEKIKYLSSLPHSALVEHCIYLENENDNYKAQKYITDFISENSIICEKNKEIERLNNIINELEKDIQKEIERTNDLILEDSSMVEINAIRRMLNEDRQCWLFELKKLKGGK